MITKKKTILINNFLDKIVFSTKESLYCFCYDSAVAQGSQMLELDVHLTRDGQVVVSHDGDLKHKFGVDANIADLDFKVCNIYSSLS